MTTEMVARVELLDTGELLLGLAGEGNPSYQYVYREAAGVYWSEEPRGFKSTVIENWSCSKWFSHIVAVVHSGLGVKLVLGKQVAWKNVPDQDIVEIERQNAF